MASVCSTGRYSAKVLGTSAVTSMVTSVVASVVINAPSKWCGNFAKILEFS
jgi:hypothetical protein